MGLSEQFWAVTYCSRISTQKKKKQSLLSPSSIQMSQPRTTHSCTHLSAAEQGEQDGVMGKEV